MVTNTIELCQQDVATIIRNKLGLDEKSQVIFNTRMDYGYYDSDHGTPVFKNVQVITTQEVEL